MAAFRLVPAGFRIVAVDCDRDSLSHLSRTLTVLGYEVTTCETANCALSVLRQNPGKFQFVLSEAFSPEMDMDGFKLCAAVVSAFQSSVQVVLFSSFCSYPEAAIRALNQGATAFYTKPIPIGVLQYLWQQFYKPKFGSFSVGEQNQTIFPPLTPTSVQPKPGFFNVGEQNQTILPPLTPPPVQNLGINAAGVKRRRGYDDGGESEDGSKGSSKKSRVCWLPELHEKFVSAVEVLRVTADSLTPRKILDLMEKMGVVGLSVSQVSSHLQQYRKRASSKKPCSSSELEQSNTPSKLVLTSTSDFFPEPTSIQDAGNDLSPTQTLTPPASDWSFCLDLANCGVESEEILALLENN